MMMKSKVFILIAMLFFLIGCKTTKQTIEKEHHETNDRTDSVSVVVEKTTKQVTTPQTTVDVKVSPEKLIALPVGASFQAKKGNATATIKKTKEDEFEFTANCDSLTILIESLNKEVYRLNREKTELKDSLKEEKIVEVNKLNGWQWFQIYGFRIYLLSTVIYILYRNIKNGKIKRLFQAISRITGGV